MDQQGRCHSVYVLLAFSDDANREQFRVVKVQMVLGVTVLSKIVVERDEDDRHCMPII